MREKENPEVWPIRGFPAVSWFHKKNQRKKKKNPIFVQDFSSFEFIVLNFMTKNENYNNLIQTRS